MSAPGAVIAEDEPLVRGEIRDTLRGLWPQLTILAEVGDGLEALAALERCAPDVFFLDIQMPGLNGLEVAQRLSGRAHVVFVTAYDRYAIAAFEQGALDYVLKPISVPRLQRTVERLQARIGSVPADLSHILDLLKEVVPAESRYLRWLTVPHGRELRVVAATEIRYLRADGKYTTLATPHGTYLMNASLRQMREKLDPEVFWQVHRSVIVNVSAIDVIYRSFRGALEIKLKDRSELLPVSGAHAHLFKDSMR
ncbi:MAG TPA: LytTR family DNA-binding domain-containing protein [Steroidobacteraceae bacterium]|nr:LytTR family DNA-binding domain-containing protein [Steroidobacteraceae bacterium]